MLSQIWIHIIFSDQWPVTPHRYFFYILLKSQLWIRTGLQAGEQAGHCGVVRAGGRPLHFPRAQARQDAQGRPHLQREQRPQVSLCHRPPPPPHVRNGIRLCVGDL